MTHRVAVLAMEDVYAFDLGIPARLFDAASEQGETRLYDVQTCTADGAPVSTSAGYRAAPEHGIDLLSYADTVVVPPPRSGSVLTDGTVAPEIAQALNAAQRRGARVMSICTGAFVLAASGLLDGRQATTHWAWTERFRRLFPEIRLNPDVLFIDDVVLTSAGAAAGIDLCLHVIRSDHGSEVANRAARTCVVPPWRDGGQSQYIDRPVPQTTDTSTAPTRAWAFENLHSPLSLEKLAAHARMSVRTFTRRFRQETGSSPTDWLAQCRLDLAKQLLESTDLPIDMIAERAGFGTGESLRQRMYAAIGVSPRAYRRTFRRKS